MVGILHTLAVAGLIAAQFRLFLGRTLVDPQIRLDIGILRALYDSRSVEGFLLFDDLIDLVLEEPDGSLGFVLVGVVLLVVAQLHADCRAQVVHGFLEEVALYFLREFILQSPDILQASLIDILNLPLDPLLLQNKSLLHPIQLLIHFRLHRRKKFLSLRPKDLTLDLQFLLIPLF